MLKLIENLIKKSKMAFQMESSPICIKPSELSLMPPIYQLV